MTTVAFELRSGIRVAHPIGDIDAFSAGGLRDELTQTVNGGSRGLIVDLSRTRYVDSAGIDMLLRLNERLRERRATLRLVIPSGSQLDRLAEIVGLHSAVAIHDSVEEAVATEAPSAAPQGTPRR